MARYRPVEGCAQITAGILPSFAVRFGAVSIKTPARGWK